MKPTRRSTPILKYLTPIAATALVLLILLATTLPLMQWWRLAGGQGAPIMSVTTEQPERLSKRIRRFLRDHPLVPLIVLLLVLVALLEVLRPGIVNERWIGNTIKFAIPLAMLAACQTLTMLTGGIDLSVGIAATISAFVVATQVAIFGTAGAIAIALIPPMLIGFANGIGVGLFRVHPLIMTLGTGLIGTGCLQVYQRTVIATGSSVPELLAWLGTGRTYGAPNSLLVFVPLAAVIIFGLRRTGFGRLLYAIGENEDAARLAGVRAWQVILALYVLSGLPPPGGIHDLFSPRFSTSFRLSA